MTEQTSPWRGRRVLVTGVTGFLGSAVARELLARGAEVVGLVHQRSATELFDSAASNRVRFVHGSADNMFRLHSAMAVHEVTAAFHLATCNSSALLQAVNRYSHRMPVVTAKRIPHLAIARTEDSHEERLSAVQFGEVFGPGNRRHFREDAAMTDGPARDFVFVRDAARACLLAAEAVANTGPHEYAFRSGWLLTERQLSAAMRGVPAPRTVEMPDFAPLANPLGWKPSASMVDALNETIAWHRKLPQTGNDSIRAAA